MDKNFCCNKSPLGEGVSTGFKSAIACIIFCLVCTIFFASFIHMLKYKAKYDSQLVTYNQSLIITEAINRPNMIIDKIIRDDMTLQDVYSQLVYKGFIKKLQTSDILFFEGTVPRIIKKDVTTGEYIIVPEIELPLWDNIDFFFGVWMEEIL